MNNFPEILDEIMGGCLSFRFTPYEDVLSIPKPVEGTIAGNIAFKSGRGFLTGYASPGSLSLEVDPKDNPAGPSYSVVVKAFYPGHSPEAAALFDSMRWHRYILEVTDASGTRKLAGTLNSPLRFMHRYKSGSNASDRPGYELEFSTMQLCPCHAYTGD